MVISFEKKQILEFNVHFGCSQCSVARKHKFGNKAFK